MTFVSLPEPGLMPCPGLELKAWWVSYRIPASGGDLQYESSGWSRVGRVDGGIRLNTEVNVSTRATCSAWFIGYGDLTPPSRLPADYAKTFDAVTPREGDPFSDTAHGRRAAVKAGLMPCPY